MKILILDDCELHRDAAVAQLSNAHDLTVASRYNEILDHRPTPTFLSSFDAVLTDLLLPAPRITNGEGLALVGQEMPLGTIIALHALQAGVALVGVLTDVNHHMHPASACFDAFRTTNPYGDIFKVGNSKVCLSNNDSGFVSRFKKEDLVTPLERWDRSLDDSTVLAKNWGWFLTYIQTGVHPIDK